MGECDVFWSQDSPPLEVAEEASILSHKQRIVDCKPAQETRSFVYLQTQKVYKEKKKKKQLGEEWLCV
jgi:hypothetical protein